MISLQFVNRNFNDFNPTKIIVSLQRMIFESTGPNLLYISEVGYFNYFIYSAFPQMVGAKQLVINHWFLNFHKSNGVLFILFIQCVKRRTKNQQRTCQNGTTVSPAVEPQRWMRNGSGEVFPRAKSKVGHTFKDKKFRERGGGGKNLLIYIA